MASVAKRVWTHKGAQKSAWVVRWLDRTGNHRQRTFEKKKDADLYRSQVETERVSRSLGTFISEKPINAIARDFLLSVEARSRDGRITKGTLKTIRTALRISILPSVGAIKLVELKAAEVENAYTQWVRDGLSPVTARGRIQVLNQLADFGVRHSYARQNVVIDALKSLRGIAPSPPIRTFSPPDIIHILRTAEMQGMGQHRRSWLMTRCIVNIAAFCGLRQGEILALQIDHIDLDARVIEVRQSLSPTDGIKAPKTRAGVRDVPMPVHVASLLRDWFSDGYTANSRGFLFIAGMGGRSSGVPLTGPGFSAGHWRPLLARAGFASGHSAQAAGATDRGDHMHFHALRHFAASWMIRNGMPIPDVAQLLGHARFDMTLKTYAHPIINGSRRLEMADSMASALFEGPPQVIAPVITAQNALRIGYAPATKSLKKNKKQNMVTSEA